MAIIRIKNANTLKMGVRRKYNPHNREMRAFLLESPFLFFQA